MYNKLKTSMLKKMTGETLWVIPLYNARKRLEFDLKKQIKSGAIVKVGSTNITLDNGIGKFNLEGTPDSQNYAYLAFLSKEEALEHIEMEEYINNLKYEMNLTKLSMEQLREIKKITETV